MKFETYLESSTLLEWRKEYIDYRGLSKIVTKIQHTNDYNDNPPGRRAARERFQKSRDRGEEGDYPTGRSVRKGEVPIGKAGEEERIEERGRASIQVEEKGAGSAGWMGSVAGSTLQAEAPSMVVRPPFPPSPLAQVLPLLWPREQEFVDKLDHELKKVGSFYKAREDELCQRVHVLHEQAKELTRHLQILRQTYSSSTPHHTHSRPTEDRTNILPHATEFLRSTRAALLHPHQDPKPVHLPSSTNPPEEPDRNRWSGATLGSEPITNPVIYKRLKRRLRAAMLECYRELEMLNNFRSVNLTGFRKALRGFEEAVKISFMKAYSDERISCQSLSSAGTVTGLIHDVETLYAALFEHDDEQEARTALRVSAHGRSHHASVLRAGTFLGISLFTTVHALVLSFQADTRAAIPNYGALLQVFGAEYLAVFFALAISLDLKVWVLYRVNYPSIFKFQTGSVLDHQQYLELPAFICFTLSGAFWLAFARVGTSNVASTTWPLAWLVFCIAFLLNPLPIAYRHTRHWFIRCCIRVLTPFWSRVGFASFFLADISTSLIFCLWNIWFLSCATRISWNGNVQHQCNRFELGAQSWVPCILTCLPAFSRLLQCVQRWYESRQTMHLVNAAKYASVIITFVFYFFWRAHGANLRGAWFPVWFAVAFLTSVFNSVWDLRVDWALKLSDGKYLRKDTVFVGKRYCLYFACITNVAIRFIWIGYIPVNGLNLTVRAFIFACFEAYRRWQWAIIRVETEHLGGSDCYRVTRDPPLPYDPHHSDSDSGDDSDEGTARVQKERLDRGRRRTYGRLGGLFSRGRKGKAAGAEGDEEDIV